MTSLPPAEVMSKTRFADLVRLLADLGYTMTRYPGSQVRFDNVVPRRRLILRDYQDDELVEPAHMAAIRGSLDVYGFMEAADFDEHIRRLIAAG